MQLRTARLCLDCEEVHDEQQCPACASETFAFITRWVPAPERRSQPRAPEPTRPEELQAYQEMLQPERHAATGWRLVRRGALGLAIVGAAGWVWGRSTPQPPQQKDASADTAPNARKDATDERGSAS